MNMPTGWYPDPHNPAELRLWDGAAWTNDVKPAPMPAPTMPPPQAPYMVCNAPQAGYAAYPVPGQPQMMVQNPNAHAAFESNQIDPTKVAAAICTCGASLIFSHGFRKDGWGV